MSLLESVRSQLKKPDAPFVMVIEAEIKPEGLEAFRAAAVEAQRATRLEAGCLDYTFHQDCSAPGKWLLFERWRTLDDLAIHLQLPHTLAVVAAFDAHAVAAPTLRVFLAI